MALLVPCRTAVAPRRSARSVPRRPVRGVLAQVAVVVAAAVAYFAARGSTEGDPDVAVAHAQRVVHVERTLGLFHEPALQQLVVDHDAALDVLNWIYIWGHWPVIAIVLVWLVRARPAQYRVLRDALFISGAIGVVVFTLYPVAPPRLAGLGLLDSITARSHAYRVLQPPAFVNQYAAVPSLHVGWDLLIGLTLVRYARPRLLRVVGAVLPLAMLTSVVLTANHYLVDGLLGAVVALTGLVAAERLAARSADVPGAAVVAAVPVLSEPVAETRADEVATLGPVVVPPPRVPQSERPGQPCGGRH